LKVSSLTLASEGGLALQGNDKRSIYYFGGTLTYTIVQKFDTEMNYIKQLPTVLPSPVLFAAGVSNNNGTFFVHNGKYVRNIIEFEEASETGKITGDLPFQSDPSAVFATAAIPSGQDGGVWVFAGNNPKPRNPVLLFRMANKTVSIPTENSTSLFPTLYEMPATLTDGKYGYLLGGIGRVAEYDGTYQRTDGILRQSN
jgi:hypothetical protein